MAWVVGGSAAMYVMGVAIADEMARYPGGPKALAESVRRGAEALRLMRWPAERLDTLGGYLTYHNLTLATLFLSLYAGSRGARAVRGEEDRHVLEEVLATGRSRSAVIRDRAAGFVVCLLLITLGLSLGVAGSMAAGGAPDLPGSFITVTTSSLVALVAYALGVLVSQLTSRSRTAAGVTAIVLTALYVGTNVWDRLGALGVVRFVSPFYYANASRALVPGYGLDGPATLVLLGMAVALLGLAAWSFQARDYGAALWARRAAPRTGRPTRVQRPVLGTVWTADLLRERFGLLAWCGATAAFSGLVALLQPAVMDAWSAFESYAGIAGGRAGISPEKQYMSLAGEIITPVIAAYVVTRAAGWTTDLAQGRVEVLLAAPVSWTRLVRERLLGATAGVAAITAAALVGLVAAAAGVGAELDAAGVARLGVDCVLLGAALASVAALVVAGLRREGAVTALAVFVGASYLLVLVVPLFSWPAWVGRLSVFGAFGHPYLEWPSFSGTLLLLVLAVVGGVLAARTAERTPKVA